MEQNQQSPLLSPQTLSPQVQPIPGEAEAAPVQYSTKANLWKNIIVIALSVLLIAGIITTVIILINRDQDEKNKERRSRRKSDKTEEVSKDTNVFTKIKNSITSEPDDSVSLPDDLPSTLDVNAVRGYCEKIGLSVTDTGNGFIAVDSSLKMIVTVQDVSEFGSLQELFNMILGPDGAQMFSGDWQGDGNSIRIEGYLDENNPQFGYTYFGMIISEDKVVIIQGLGESKNDYIVTQASDLHDTLDDLLKN